MFKTVQFRTVGASFAWARASSASTSRGAVVIAALAVVLVAVAEILAASVAAGCCRRCGRVVQGGRVLAVPELVAVSVARPFVRAGGRVRRGSPVELVAFAVVAGRGRPLRRRSPSRGELRAVCVAVARVSCRAGAGLRGSFNFQLSRGRGAFQLSTIRRAERGASPFPSFFRSFLSLPFPVPRLLFFFGGGLLHWQRNIYIPTGERRFIGSTK